MNYRIKKQKCRLNAKGINLRISPICHRKVSYIWFGNCGDVVSCVTRTSSRRRVVWRHGITLLPVIDYTALDTTFTMCRHACL